MFHVRVPFHTIGKRLDSEHYDPEALALEGLLRSRPGLSRIGDIVNPRRQITNGVRGPDIADSEYRLVRLQDCKEWEIDTSDCLAISREQFESNRRCRLFPGDVVVAIGGYLGNAAVVSAEVPAVIGQHSALLPFGHQTTNDPRYLVAFLNSRMGEVQFRRWSRGSIQTGLNLEDVVDIEILCPDGEVQSYIGSKVRQAEVLRAWARCVEDRFRSCVELQVPESFQRARQSRVSSQDLDHDLNPGRFTPDRLEVRRALELNNGLRLEKVVSISTENLDTPPQDSRYLGLDGISSSSIDVTYQSLSEAEISGTFRCLPRGAAISKLRPYLNKAVFIDGGLGPVVGSSELLCLQSDEVHPAYLYGVLKLDTTVRQLSPVASGATHPRISPEDVLDLFVPWSDEHQCLGISLEKAQQAYFSARRLTSAARQLVEALIEGNVTEAELIAAGKDPDADCALLARLRDDGLDGAGSRLFPDIEALFELIEQVQGTEADS